MSGATKFDFVSGVVMHFIATLLRPGVDRCLIASCGEDFRIDQDFTSDPGALRAALAAVGRSINKERTALYDSAEKMAATFYAAARRDRPWLVVTVTDGCDNASVRWKDDPAGVGGLLARRFTHDPTNHLVVVGVGSDERIDRRALATLGQAANCPAVALDRLDLLDGVFLQIALRVTSRLVGLRHTVGSVSWDEIARVREVAHVPIEVGFLLDRSGSMSEPAVRGQQGQATRARQANPWWGRN